LSSENEGKVKWLCLFYAHFNRYCSALSISSHSPIPDTGQTKCYNDTVEIPCPAPGEPFYGQDGNYTINLHSYTKLNAGGATLPDSARPEEQIDQVESAYPYKKISIPLQTSRFQMR
jgi:hypothetical protein